MSFFAIFLAATVTTVAPEYLIVPGKSVGPVRIGMTREQVRAAWGEPTREGGELPRRGLFFKGKQPEFDTDEWWDNEQFLEGRIVYYLGGRVYQVDVENPKFRLANGLGAYTLAPDWIRSRPGPFRYAIFMGKSMMSYEFIIYEPTRGIALNFTPPQTQKGERFCDRAYVSFFAVFEPGSKMLLRHVVKRERQYEIVFDNMPKLCE